MTLFFALAWVLGRRFLERIAAAASRLSVSEPLMALVVVVAFLYAFAAEYLGGLPSAIVVTAGPAAVFPFGMALGTSVRLLQTFEYRQQLATVDPRATFWVNGAPPGEGLIYRPDHLEFGPLAVTTVSQQAIPFDLSIPIVLDLEHNGNFGTTTSPYFWRLSEVAASSSGQLLAVVVVHLTTPEAAGVTLPLFDLDLDGVLGPVRQTTFVPFFPGEVDPLLWALVDLGTGQVVAKTSGDVVTITSRVALEGGPWANPQLPSPLGKVWLHATNVFIGVPPANVAFEGWSGVVSLQDPRGLPPIGERTSLQARVGVRQLTIEGWIGGELRTELASRGLLDVQVTTSVSSPTDFIYDCVSATSCSAVEYRVDAGVVTGAPVQLANAQRARPAPGGERLVFLATREAEGSLTGHVVVWDPGARAQTLATFGPGIHVLGTVTGSAALVESEQFEPFSFSSLVIPLDGTQAPVDFPGESLTATFTLLAPSFLYDIETMKFYRLQAPLQRSALPARLAAVPKNRNGDYHAVPLK